MCIRRFVALLIVFWLTGWSASVSAQQNFTLTIPVRPGLGAMQTAVLRIAFESSGISAGAQVTVAGTAINVPNLGDPSNAANVAGDFVQVIRRATNVVQLVITTNSDFPADFCTSTRAASETLAVSLTSVNATGFRMAGYIAPSTENCAQGYRRVGTNAPFLTPPAGVANNGRLPLDVILVLDKSGSMGWSLPGGGAGETRWQRLIASVGQFMALWKQAVAPGVEGSADDRIGLVFFDSSAQDGILEAGSIFKKRGPTSAGWDDATHGDVVSAQIVTRSPGGSTSIGAGLDLGHARWNALALEEKNDPTIVVFTDGEQNTPPRVEPVPATIAPVLLNGEKLSGRAIPMLTIGLGAQSGSFANLLDQIANETAGRSRITTGGMALDMLFDDQLVEALKGNTLSLQARQVEQLPSSGTGTSMAALIDASVTRTVFVLGWEGLRSNSLLGLKIFKPDGTPAVAVAEARGDFWLVASVDIPATGPAGEWHAQAVLRDNTEATINYHLSAYAVEGRLDYRFTVTPAAVGTGKPVVMRAELGFDGKALDKLPAGSLKVRIERPGENLGTILHVSEAQGTTQPDGSPTSGKIEQLAAQEKLLGRIEPQPLPNTFDMQDKGDGVYEVSFDETNVGGQYRLRVSLDWNDTRTGRIKRTEIVERQIPVLPTLADSQATVQRDATGGVLIQATPKDRFGNFVGPGFADLFHVVVTGGGTAVHPPTDPSVRGIYAIRLTGVPTNADPHVKITYRGETLRDSPLSQIDKGPPGKGTGGLPMLWIWILILVLILIILVVWIRRKSSTP